MQLVLIRHSKTTLEKDKSNLVWQLSPEGIALAEQLSQNPSIKNLEVLYSSDQTKALHTALLLAKDNYIPIRVEQSLTEATSITNGFFENYEKEMGNWHTDPTYRINNGETTEEALIRFSIIIDRLVARHTTIERLGIVSHANILSLFTSQYESRTSLEIHHAIRMPDYAIVDWDTKKLLKTFGND